MNEDQLELMRQSDAAYAAEECEMFKEMMADRQKAIAFFASVERFGIPPDLYAQTPKPDAD